jgi:hypothetical protein
MPLNWNVLSGGDGVDEDVVLASDFPATGRTVAGFGDLVKGLGLSASVWETAPPRAGEERGMTGADYVERWLPAAEDRTVTVVLGFCVGAVFAAELATRIGARGTAPRLVLFDPERPDPDLLHRHYHELIGGLSSVLTETETEKAREAGRQARARHTTMRSLGGELCALFAEFGEPAFHRTGLDASRSGEVVATFTSFLSYLVAAADLDPLKAWSAAVAISSGSAHSGLNVLPEPERARTVAREIRFDMHHGELLRDMDVAEVARPLLG